MVKKYEYIALACSFFQMGNQFYFILFLNFRGQSYQITGKLKKKNLQRRIISCLARGFKRFYVSLCYLE